jgi:hypothetical protein
MSNETKMLKDEKLENVSGGAIRPKYVSSFFCEKCGKTIHLNGVYTLERAKEEHERKEHSGKKK